MPITSGSATSRRCAATAAGSCSGRSSSATTTRPTGSSTLTSRRTTWLQQRTSRGRDASPSSLASFGASPPTIVAGDLNDAGTPEIVAALPGIEVLDPPPTNPSERPTQALDHVLVPVDGDGCLGVGTRRRAGLGEAVGPPPADRAVHPRLGPGRPFAPLTAYFFFLVFLGSSSSPSLRTPFASASSR